MSHIPRPDTDLRPGRFFNAATYQTNPNPPEHSKSFELRLTLVMLWFLRVPLMVRTALIALLLVPFIASSAAAARIKAVHDPAHADVTSGTIHRTHHPARPVSHSSRTSSRSSHTSRTKHSSRTATHHTSRTVSSPSHRVSKSTRRTATLRRSRYVRHHPGAHFVPLATVPVERSRPFREQATSTSGERSSDFAAAAPASADADSNPTSEPRAAEASSAPESTPLETDTASAPGTEPARIAAAGNPLAAPPISEGAVASPNAQIASLHAPHIFGRYALRGTHDSLVRQNARSEDEALERIEDDADLQNRIGQGFLVRVPESSALTVNAALPEDRRYCRPWTADFLTDLARSHLVQFHKPLVVSSAVRTVEYQKRLMRINHNAADAEGDIVSPHLTGATIDIAKSGLSRREMQWMRDHLAAYQSAGFIDVEEEFRQRCFHITVYKTYSAGTASRNSSSSFAAPSESAGSSSAAEVVSKDQ